MAKTHSTAPRSLDVIIDGRRFTLVPYKATRKPTERRYASKPATPHLAHDRATARPVVAPPAPLVRYRAKFPLSHTRVKTIRKSKDYELYRLLRTCNEGATRPACLLAMKSSEHPGVVDGAVRRLRLKGLIQAVYK